MEIRIDELGTKEVTTETVVNRGISYVDSQTIPKGETQLISEGNDGVVKQTLLQHTVNGEVTSSELLDYEVVSFPVNDQYYLGVGGVITASDGTDYTYSYYMDVEATAYSYSAGSHTATGEPVGSGIIAVDPDVIPLHTSVYVTGNYGDYGVCNAEDVGGSIKGNKIDIFMESEDACLAFGRRTMRVYILD
jgi:3D (Asp-Asp-Asp) domain-containing protein